ncbi:MAG: transposase [Proteobacteria bacterium]|nr:transposase [Pseudomonadota bacterium]
MEQMLYWLTPVYDGISLHNCAAQHWHADETGWKEMAEPRELELKDHQILPSAKKILKSLSNHWQGLMILVDHPHIPMDNNAAERGLRGSVLGRKNYYGSGSVWSAELAAVMFTILKTLKLWDINPHTWILAYLQECAMRGGSPPELIDHLLPWNMNSSLRQLMAKPPKFEQQHTL